TRAPIVAPLRTAAQTTGSSNTRRKRSPGGVSGSLPSSKWGPEYIPKIDGAARPVTREITCWYILTSMARTQHPSIFDDVAALPQPARDLVELGSRIPSSVRFGVSTWTYDGWTGDVYHRAYRGAQPARVSTGLRAGQRAAGARAVVRVAGGEGDGARRGARVGLVERWADGRAAARSTI